MVLPLIGLAQTLTTMYFDSIADDQAITHEVEPIIRDVCDILDYHADWHHTRISDEGIGLVYFDILEDENLIISCIPNRENRNDWECSCSN